MATIDGTTIAAEAQAHWWEVVPATVWPDEQMESSRKRMQQQWWAGHPRWQMWFHELAGVAARLETQEVEGWLDWNE